MDHTITCNWIYEARHNHISFKSLWIQPNDHEGHPSDGPSDGTARPENKLIELFVTYFGRLYTRLYLSCSSLLTCLRKLLLFPDILVFVSSVQIESFSTDRKFLEFLSALRTIG